jgi:hypothetical protein
MRRVGWSRATSTGFDHAVTVGSHRDDVISHFNLKCSSHYALQWNPDRAQTRLLPGSSIRRSR